MNISELKKYIPGILLVLFFATGCHENINTSGNHPLSEEWKGIGPGGGGGVFLPTVSPFDEDFVFTYCDM